MIAEAKLNTEAKTEILFVDDEEGLRVTLSLVLQSFGFSVTTAATVPEALTLIASHKFDSPDCGFEYRPAG